MLRIHPFILVAVVGSVAAFSVLNVKFSASLYEMLPRDLPEVQGMDRLNRFFSRDGQLIVTIKAEEAYIADEATTDLAIHLEENTDLVSEVFRELSLTELVTEGGGLLAWLWLNAPPEELEKLLARLAPGESSDEIAKAMESIQNGFFDQKSLVTSYDPLGFSRIGDSLGGGPDPMTSTDGTFQIVYVEGKNVDFSDYREAAKWLEEMKEVVEQWERSWLDTQEPGTNVDVGLTGTPAFMAEVGAEMERDMTISVVATMLLISLLFWIMHRQTRPLSWLVTAMLAILAITLNLGGLIFGDLSVMSAGFAAILMGLAVDYGIVLYREAMEGNGDAGALRRSVGPGILWAAATTAVVFLSLNLSSLPGLAEMGNLVAIGIAVGAGTMLFFFAPVAVRFNKVPVPEPRRGLELTGLGFTRKWSGLTAIVVPLIALISIVAVEMPGLEANFHPFRIRESPSMKSWQQLQSELRGRENAVPTVITGESLPDLIANVEAAETRVASATESGLVSDSILPIAFIPNPDRQRTNKIEIQAILSDRARLLNEIGEAGFSEDGAALTATVFDAWQDYLGQESGATYATPTGKLAVWSIDRLFSKKGITYAALGTVTPTSPRDREWVSAICDENTTVASLGSLGTALNERIKADLVRVFLPMMGLLVLMLAIVFRNWRDLALSVFCLAFSAAGLVILTVWTPLSWNSFNVCGLPLLFGTGLDFSIHMIFALRRGHGDVAAARRGIGKALLFCGTSSAIGFGSLATASAHGLASLGIVCAIGILANMFVAVWMLPRWYGWLHGVKNPGVSAVR